MTTQRNLPPNQRSYLTISAITLLTAWCAFATFGDFNLYLNLNGIKTVKDYPSLSGRIFGGLLLAIPFTLLNTSLLWGWDKLKTGPSIAHPLLLLVLFTTITIGDTGKTTLRKSWASSEYSTNSVPLSWRSRQMPATQPPLSEFIRFSLKTETLSIQNFINKYGLPTRYLTTSREHAQDYLIYDLPAGEAVALYVSKPPTETFAAIAIIDREGELIKLIK